MRGTAGSGQDATAADVRPPDPADTDRVESRADLLPEEAAVGSASPSEQAAAILHESDVRTEEPNAAPDTVLERRTSDQATDPV